MLDYAYFKDNYRIIAVDLSKQKALDADPRAIQQIVFQWKTGQNLRLWKMKNNGARILETNSKLFVRMYKWLNTIK